MSETNKKFEGCKNLQKLLEAQTKVMKRHIDKHKWFKHIDNIDEALLDFTEAYAWLMREMFCTECCPYREECKMFDEILKQNNETK